MPSFSPLICHPANASPGDFAITAEVRTIEGGALQFSYELTGASGLKMPPPSVPQAVDGLWQDTCCEAFVAAKGGRDYREFNFSPSRCWAAYRFNDYRDRDLGWTSPAAPAIETRLDTAGDRLLLVARVPASLLPDVHQLDISLTAVIEDREGRKTYWALAHQAPNPDFHCRDSFTLPLNRS